MRRRFIAIFVSLFIFLSCLSAVWYVDGTVFGRRRPESTTPFKELSEENVFALRDAAYGDYENQTLDVAIPRDKDNIGLVVYIHGGGWISGDKTKLGKVRYILKSNKYYATASLNYRYAQTGMVSAKDIVEDVGRALHFIDEKAKENRSNINEVILMGHSAGGHISLLFSYKYSYLSPFEIKAVFAFSPASDLTFDKFYTQNSIGSEESICKMISKVCAQEITPENRKDMQKVLADFSPINYVSSESPYTVIVHGKNDTVVPFEIGENFKSVLEEKGVRHTFISVEGAGHNLSGGDPAIKDLLRYVIKLIVKLFEIEI